MRMCRAARTRVIRFERDFRFYRGKKGRSLILHGWDTVRLPLNVKAVLSIRFGCCRVVRRELLCPKQIIFWLH